MRYDELRAQAALAAGPLEHVARAYAWHPSWDQAVDLDPTDLGVTFDEGWAPHVQADLTAPVPEDDALERLDPRAGVRLMIEAGYRYDDGTEDVALMGDLGMRSRVVTRPDNTMRLEAASDEALLQDNLWTSATPAPLPRAGVGEAVSYLLANGLPGSFLDSQVPAGHRADLLMDAELPAGEDYWQPARSLTDDAGLWLYDDGTRVFRLEQRPAVAGRVRANLTTGAAGTVTHATARLDRDGQPNGWGNAVYVRNVWRDSAGVERVVHGRAWVRTGPLAAGTVGWRWQRVERTTPTTQAGANAAAAAILRRTVTRGRGLELTAVAAYWLRPGMTVTAQLPTGEQQRHLVSRVSFDLTAGLMHVTTRQPDDVEIQTGE